MAGYIGSKGGVVQLDGYIEAQADAEFVTKTGDAMSGHISLGDNNRARFGNSQDLQIYHDGSNSYISDVGTGGLKLTGGDIYIRNPSDADIIHATSGGHVKLYHNASEKLATT